MDMLHLTKKLRAIRPENCRSTGLYSVIQFLVWYFERPKIQRQPEITDTNLSKVIADGICFLTIGMDTQAIQCRVIYKRATGHDISKILHYPLGSLERESFIFLMSEEIAYLVDFQNHSLLRDRKTNFHVENMLFESIFKRFITNVYQAGELYNLVMQAPSLRRIGYFGQTRISSIVILGYVNITLNRLSVTPENDYLIIMKGAANDCFASFEIFPSTMNPWTAIDMIRDIIENWPTTKQERNRAFNFDLEQTSPHSYT